MRKTTRNYIIDAVSGLFLLFQGIIGFLLWFVVPHGQGRHGAGTGFNEDAPAFLFDRHTWIDIHDWLAVALVILFVMHIVIHWRWIYYMTKSYFRQNEIYG